MNYETSATNQCPNCMTPAQGQTITESCRLLPADVSPSLELVLKTCICPTELQAFIKTGSGVDPCQQCPHNEIIEDAGTFVAMKQVGDCVWGEIHNCPHCHTTFIVLNQQE